MPSLFVPEEAGRPAAGARTTRSPCGAQIHHGMDGGRLRLLGLLAVQRSPRAATRVYGVDAHRHGPERLPVQRGPRRWSTTATPAARTAPALPDPPPSAYTNGVVTPHAAFLALRYAPRRGAAPTSRRLERDFPGIYGELGLPRRGQRRHRARVRLLPVARPGHGHGGARQRARRRRAARGVRRRPTCRRALRPGDRRRGVQLRPARLHDHRHRRPRQAARHRRRRRDLRARRRRRDRGPRRRRRRLRRRGRRRGRAAAPATTPLYGGEGDDALSGGDGDGRALRRAGRRRARRRRGRRPPRGRRGIEHLRPGGAGDTGNAC